MGKARNYVLARGEMEFDLRKPINAISDVVQNRPRRFVNSIKSI